MKITRAANRIMGGVFLFFGAIFAVVAPANLYDVYAHEAAKEAALAAGPPPLTPIEAFDAARDVGRADEVRVLAQLAPQSVTTYPAPRTRFIAPLLASDETDPNGPPLAWMAHDTASWDPAAVAQNMRGSGPTGGPLIELNGVVVDPAPHFSAFERVAAAGAGEGVVIQPFMSGRGAALAPDASAVNTALFGLLAPVGAIGFGLLSWRRGRPPAR